MPKLTLCRSLPGDKILIAVRVFNPVSEAGVEAKALFDTGCDHTVVSASLFDRISLTPTGREIPVQGVTGGTIGRTARVTLGMMFDGGKKVTIDNHEVAVADSMTDDVLIGRDFLGQFDISIFRNGLFTMEC